MKPFEASACLSKAVPPRQRQILSIEMLPKPRSLSFLPGGSRPTAVPPLQSCTVQVFPAHEEQSFVLLLPHALWYNPESLLFTVQGFRAQRSFRC